MLRASKTDAEQHPDPPKTILSHFARFAWNPDSRGKPWRFNSSSTSSSKPPVNKPGWKVWTSKEETYKQYTNNKIIMEVRHHRIYDSTRNRGTGRIHNCTCVDDLSSGIRLYHRVSLGSTSTLTYPFLVFSDCTISCLISFCLSSLGNSRIYP